MRLKGAIYAAGAIIWLGGCSFGGLVGGSPPATYDLIAPAVARSRDPHSIQLTINAPVAVKTIDTEEILVKTANGRVAYFPGVAWGDRLPRLFQARLGDVFANSGAFRAILTNQDRVTGDLSLSSEIRDFEVEASPAGSEAVIDIYVKLVDERNNAVTTTRRFQARTPAPPGDVAGGVQALNETFQKVALEIVAWVSKRSGQA
jgi:cholesterol transport system auxiliary component